MRYEELTIEGRNAVLEAFRAGKPIDRLFILDGCQDGPVKSILREAKKHDTIITFVPKERLDQMSDTGHHQGVIAYGAAYEYAEVEDMLKAAEEKGEPPFLILLDGIEDPHNLGAIIRTANLAGAHGVIGLVVGNEGDGVSRLVREKCDMTASIPMQGQIDSLNASVAAGVLAYEIVRQRMGKK